MPRTSAGLLLYRRGADGLEVLLVHPGGPLFQAKDLGSWSIPKGEYEPSEDPLDAALREFAEELGHEPPDGETVFLGDVVQSGGKRVSAWALAGDLDVSDITSNTFDMEWPPRSRRRQAFPEVDRAGWFTPLEAKAKMNPAQRAFVDQLASLLED